MHQDRNFASRRISLVIFFICTLFQCLACASANEMKGLAPLVPSGYSNLPLTFEENKGQLSNDVKFLARGQGFNLFLTGHEAVLVLPQRRDNGQSALARGHSVIRMGFIGANEAPVIKGVAQLEMRTNYFYGSSAQDSVVNIPNHEAVQYSGVYPGIDLIYYSKGKLLEYDLRVAPLANPQLIRLDFSGARSVVISESGDLVVGTDAGDLINQHPVAYQFVDGKRVSVDVRYRLATGGGVRFELGEYDSATPLVIDPVVTFAYQFWAWPTSIAVDSAGNSYVAGNTNAAQLPPVAGYRTAIQGTSDAFVIKLDPSGTKALYATYIGATKAPTSAVQVAVDISGNAYLTGTTSSSAFPTTVGAYNTTFVPTKAGDITSFLLKLNSAGNALVYSTFINFRPPTIFGDSVRAIAVDPNGNVFLAGDGDRVVTTAGAYRTTIPNTVGSTSGFVAKLNATGTAMIYATYLGGSQLDTLRRIAIDPAGNAYVTGTSGSSDFPLINTTRTDPIGIFVSKLNPSATALAYSTTLGVGTEPNIAVNGNGEAFIAGNTDQASFPVTNGVFQPVKGWPNQPVSTGFLTKLNTSGALSYSTFLGGISCNCGDQLYSTQDEIRALGIDTAGYAYVGGNTRSRKFPSIDAVGGSTWVHSDEDDSYSWPFVARIAPTGDHLVFATTIGARGAGKGVIALAIDTSGGVIALGNMSNNGYAYAEYVNNIPVAAGAPALPSATASLSFIFKLATGKNPTTIRKPTTPAIAGLPVTIVADVLSTKTGGSVTFADGAVTLGTAVVANGAASLQTIFGRGVHKITAVYSLDGVESPPVFYVVNGE